MQEAAHVDTPPLKQLTTTGKPRSLFMDIKHPIPLEEESSNGSDSIKATPRVFTYRAGQVAEKKEWWDAPKGTTKTEPVKDVSFFEFDLPEHLPTSPMCPANPKYKGKGKLVCVVSLGRTSCFANIMARLIILSITEEVPRYPRTTTMNTSKASKKSKVLKA